MPNNTDWPDLAPDVNSNNQTYSDLIRFDPGSPSGEETLPRLPLGTPVADGGMDESSLRDLLFQFPRSLPVAAIDAAYSDPVPVCRELSTHSANITETPGPLGITVGRWR